MVTKATLLTICVVLVVVATCTEGRGEAKRLEREGSSRRSDQARPTRSSQGLWAPCYGEDCGGPVRVRWYNANCEGAPEDYYFPFRDTGPAVLQECYGEGGSATTKYTLEPNYLVRSTWFWSSPTCQGHPDEIKKQRLNQCYTTYSDDSYAIRVSYNDKSKIAPPIAFERGASKFGDYPLQSCSDASGSGCNATFMDLNQYQLTQCAGNIAGWHQTVPYDTCMYDPDPSEFTGLHTRNVVFRCTANGAQFDTYYGKCDINAPPDESHLYVADRANSNNTHSWTRCQVDQGGQSYRQGCVLRYPLPPETPSSSSASSLYIPASFIILAFASSVFAVLNL